MEKELKDVLLAEKNEEIITIGIMAEPKEGVTKQGKPFVDFTLYSKGYSLPAKVWDMGVEEMMERYHVKAGTPVKVHGTVSVNPLSGEKQLCLRDGECPAIATLEMEESEVSALSQSTPISEEEMLKALRAVVDKFIPEETDVLRGISLFSLEYLSKYSYFPYDSSVHKEKGGFLAHIYNCCHKLIYYVGGPNFDKRTVLAALLSYHIGVFVYYNVDNVTGIIKNNNELLEYGSLDELCSDFLFNWNSNIESCIGTCWSLIRNFIGCIKAVNNQSEPISLEAAVTKTIVDSELKVYRIYEATKGLPECSKTYISEGGEMRAVFKF